MCPVMSLIMAIRRDGVGGKWVNSSWMEDWGLMVSFCVSVLVIEFRFEKIWKWLKKQDFVIILLSLSAIKTP